LYRHSPQGNSFGDKKWTVAKPEKVGNGLFFIV
jgi:hypothetical protein